MNKFILEIGTEEIPSIYIDSILKYLKNNARNYLEQSNIDYDSIDTWGTPRRLILYVEGIASQQKDIFQKIKGPPTAIAFNSKGKPENPVIKFSQVNRVKLKDLIIEKTNKGEYVFARKLIKGKKIELVLPEICLNLIDNINLSKSMKWGDTSIRFIRPIRWLLTLYNNKVIPLKLGGLTSNRITFGHRLLTTGPIKVDSAGQYFAILKKNYVIIDPVERKEIIESQILQIIKNNGGREYIDQMLLEDVKNLVEYPKVLMGRFDKKYLDLPAEVLTAVMTKHQKYFPVYCDKEALLPLFLVVINGNEERYSESIVKGNERVLRARLEDAKFFYQEDQKTTEPALKFLDNNRDKLKNIVFQENLGTVYDKVERLATISDGIAQELQLSPDSRQILKRSVQLCKSDLVTEMVKEFPELQGIMGKEYALLQGEDSQVATTIYEHYLPRYSGDSFPTTVTGSILSITDKLDNIVSCFVNDLIPDGSQDPYALRRQALGIINIILLQEMYFSISQVIELNINILLKDRQLAEQLTPENKSNVQIIKDFIFQRLRYLLLEKKYRYDIIDAVLAKNPDNILDILTRITAIQNIYQTPGFIHTITAATRAFNLSRNAPGLRVNISLFQEKEEHSLYNHYLKVKEIIEKLIKRHCYDDVFLNLETMNVPIDTFFDKILVMVEDEKIRSNRLALLRTIADLYFSVADLTKIALAKGTIKGESI